MTATTAVFAALLALFGVFHYLSDRRWTAERARLINEVMSKTAAEFRLRQIAAGQDEPKRLPTPDRKPKPEQLGL